jgi:hypothetical protein
VSYYLKDPGSRIDYAVEWLPYLDGLTIAGSEWIVEPAETGGIAIEGERFDATRSAATLSGGIVGHVYSISNWVTLSDDSVDVRSICLRVEKR